MVSLSLSFASKSDRYAPLRVLLISEQSINSKC